MPFPRLGSTRRTRLPGLSTSDALTPDPTMWTPHGGYGRRYQSGALSSVPWRSTTSPQSRPLGKDLFFGRNENCWTTSHIVSESTLSGSSGSSAANGWVQHRNIGDGDSASLSGSRQPLIPLGSECALSTYSAALSSAVLASEATSI